MKFFVVSMYGSGAGFTWKIQEEGNDVFWFIKKPFYRTILKGLVPQVQSIEDGLAKKPDIVIFDFSTMGKEADKCKEKGFRVIGGGAFNDLLELNRTYGMKLAKRVGIKVPQFEVFAKDQIKEAIQYVEESQGRYVLKPDGDEDKDLTYVAKDAADMISQLQWIEKENILKGDFLLQDFIGGIEISTEMWFSNGNPIPALANSTIERKKLMTGDLGPATGSESSIVWPYGTDRTKIIDKTLAKMYPILKEMNYTGPIDINAMVSGGEPYFLEFTPRFGYYAINAFLELVKGNVSDFFYDIAIGRIEDLSLKNDLVGTSLTVSIPPYPHAGESPEKKGLTVSSMGQTIEGVPNDHVWPFNVMLKDKEIVSAGAECIICIPSSSGKTVEEAEDNLYKEVKEIQAPNIQYRIDAGEKAMEYFEQLSEMGYTVPISRIEDKEGEAVTAGFEEED